MKKTEVECCDTFCIHEELVHKAEGHIPDEEVLKDLADFFKVFCRYHADPDFMCSFSV